MIQYRNSVLHSQDASRSSTSWMIIQELISIIRKVGISRKHGRTAVIELKSLNINIIEFLDMHITNTKQGR